MNGPVGRAQAPSKASRAEGPDQTSGGMQGRDRLEKVLSPILVLTFIFFLHFLGRQLAGPLLPVMETDLGFSHAVSGLFILFLGIGLFVSQLGAAVLSALLGYRRCIVLSLWGTAAAMAAVGWSGSVWTLSIAFFGVGVTSGLYAPSGIALISVLLHPQDWGKAMGIHEVAPNLALILAPFFATATLALLSWRWAYLGLSGVLAVMGAVYAKRGVDAEFRATFPDIQRIKATAGHPSFWVLGGLFSLGVGVETGVYSVLPLFLVHERGYDLAAANQLLGLSRIPGLIMVLVSGWITDRLGPKATLQLAMALTGVTVILLGVGPDGTVIPFVFLQAGASACLFPPILSAASGISTPENRALTLSLSLAIAPLAGGGILPAGIAFAGELGSFGLGLAGTGVLVLAGTGLVRLLRAPAG